MTNSYYTKFTQKAMNTLTGGDVYNAIQDLKEMGADTIQYLQFLLLMLQALTIDSSGRKTVIQKPSSYYLEALGVAGANALVCASGQACQILQVHNVHGADAGKVIFLNADAALDYQGAGANVLYYSSTMNADSTTNSPFGERILPGPVYVTASAGSMAVRALIFS